jgi:hypothetical protein
MAEPSTTSPRGKRPLSKPPLASRRAARPRINGRILERLTMGLSVAHIARVEGLTVRSVRQIIAETLARREIDAPAGFAQLQIARLSEAMIVARTMMIQGNLEAMDRWIKLTSELDRYHGFSPVQISRARETPSRRPQLTNSTRGQAEGKFFASQVIEITRNGEGISELAAASARPRYALSRRACEEIEGKFSASQSVEIARNRERISETSPPSEEPSLSLTPPAKAAVGFPKPVV